MSVTTRINRIAIGDSLRRSAVRRPDKVALVEGDRRLSYRQLDAQVNRFANYLLGLGLAKGQAVATLCLNSSELVIAAYGIAKAGLVWVPINAQIHGEALRYILEQVEARLVIADDELLPRTMADITRCARGCWSSRPPARPLRKAARTRCSPRHSQTSPKPNPRSTSMAPTWRRSCTRAARPRARRA